MAMTLTDIGGQAATVWWQAELMSTPTNRLQKPGSTAGVYSYEDHVELARKLDAEGRLPATFMVVAPGSWSDEVWDDINRMRTLNTTQSQRRAQMHVCPLQLDIVERLINRYSNPGTWYSTPLRGFLPCPSWRWTWGGAASAWS
ncbi:MAG: hypothetical protein ACLUI3_03165 [Christensenellales bacterium]